MKSSPELLRHIADRADFLIQKSEGLSKEAYLQNEVLQLAFERSIEIIGEAVSKLPEELREAHPQIEWSKIKAMRNLLIHVYWGINQEVVWDVARHHAPTLKAEVEKLLKTLDVDDQA